MFAKPMCVTDSSTHKRKSVFADDKTPWPAQYYKRPCLSALSLDVSEAIFGTVVSQVGHASVWIPKPEWQACDRLKHGIPMQRIVRPSLGFAWGQQVRAPSPLAPALQNKQTAGACAQADDIEMSCELPSPSLYDACELKQLDDVKYPVRKKRIGPLVRLPPYTI